MDIRTEETDDGIAVLSMDDGKANAMDLAFFAHLDDALDACADARGVLIRGRESFFSAGLDTDVLATLDTDGLTELLVAFGETMLRVWSDPRPVVAAATGHAVAGGTVLAMACDHAVAAAGDFRWGLTETAIGLPMPAWIIAIARGNLRIDHLDDLVLQGCIVDAATAVEVGFADEMVPPLQVVDRAMARVRERADLPRNAYSYTKRMLRGAAIDRVCGNLQEDVGAAMAAR